MINGRGIGSVMGVVLFVLLSIASVAVIWSVAITNVKKTASSASNSADCLALDVSVSSCVLNLTEFEQGNSAIWNIMYLNFEINRGPNSKISYLDLDFEGVRMLPPFQVNVLNLNNTYEIDALQTKKVIERIYARADLIDQPPYFIPINPQLWYFSPLFNTFWSSYFGQFFFPINIKPKVVLENGVICPLPPIKCSCVDEYGLTPPNNAVPWCDNVNLARNLLGV